MGFDNIPLRIFINIKKLKSFKQFEIKLKIGIMTNKAFKQTNSSAL